MIFGPFNYDRDYRKQRNLFSLSFPETQGEPPETDDFYDWKFRQFPAEKPSYEYCLLPEEQNGSAQPLMAAYYAALPYRYNINGKIVPCGMVCDVMTHPDLRGQGLFTKIGRFATEDLKNQGLGFVSGYPIRPEVIPGHLKVGWRIAFDLPLYMQVLSANSILKTKNLGFLAWAINPFLWAWQSVASRLCKRDPNHCVDTAEINWSDEAVLGPECYTFIAKWQQTQKYYLLKTTEFMKWRLSAPGSQYHLVKVFNKNEVIALAIARKTIIRGIHSLAVLDFMSLPSEPRASASVVYGLQSLAVSLNAEVIITMCSRHQASLHHLVRNGFIKTHMIFKLILKPLAPQFENDDFFEESNWSLTWLDSDDL